MRNARHDEEAKTRVPKLGSEVPDPSHAALTGRVTRPVTNSPDSSSSSSIYFPYFHMKLQIYIIQWQATRKTQSSTSWRPIINRTVVNILLRKNIQWNKKRKKL